MSEDKGWILESDTGREGQEEETRSEKTEEKATLDGLQPGGG